MSLKDRTVCDGIRIICFSPIEVFKTLNPSFKNYKDWVGRAENGAYEVEVFEENNKLILMAA